MTTFYTIQIFHTVIVDVDMAKRSHRGTIVTDFTRSRRFAEDKPGSVLAVNRRKGMLILDTHYSSRLPRLITRFKLWLEI